MSGKIIKTTIGLLIIFSITWINGCATDAQSGALTGGLVGAGIGQLAGGNTEATLIGAAVGTGAGYIFGNEKDKQRADAERYAISQQVNYTTVYVTNSNGSQIPVRLKKYGPDYIGPKGEIYRNGLPSSEDLRMVYGF